MELSTGIATDAQAQTADLPKQDTADIPGIVAPGPWIAFGALAFGVAFEHMQKFGILSRVPSQLRDIAAFALVAYGGWLIYRANVVFRRAETAFQPWLPTRAIAAVGVYARTRNPMYQGFVLLVLGLAVLFRLDWTVLLLIPAAALIHHGVVLREERYLLRRFGDAYRAYAGSVPRYGWPLIGSVQRRSKP
jgi:protein-S-isoprenylcysteine O-methyltransferase Ste14